MLSIVLMHREKIIDDAGGCFISDSREKKQGRDRTHPLGNMSTSEFKEHHRIENLTVN